jgi:hypothetical protein
VTIIRHGTRCPLLNGGCCLPWNDVLLEEARWAERLNCSNIIQIKMIHDCIHLYTILSRAVM